MPALVPLEAIERLRKARLTLQPTDESRAELRDAAEHLLEETYGGEWWQDPDVTIGGVKVRGEPCPLCGRKDCPDESHKQWEERRKGVKRGRV